MRSDSLGGRLFVAEPWGFALEEGHLRIDSHADGCARLPIMCCTVLAGSPHWIAVLAADLARLGWLPKAF
jgi:hypothetical protein